MNKKKLIGIIVIIIAVIMGVIFIAKQKDNKIESINKEKIDEKDKQSVANVENVNTMIDEPEVKPVKLYNNEVPILCYHGVLDEAWGDKSIFEKVDEFEKQMKYLSENGYTTLFISEIEDANKYEKPIILTFDDGYRDVYTNAFPILKKYNMKATLYIISGYLNGEYYLTTDMVKELAEHPLIEIGSHTVNHSVLTKKSDEEVEKQLCESKRYLEELTGKKIESIAYPTGAYDARIMKATEKHYKYGISIVAGKENTKQLNTYELRRLYIVRDFTIEKFKEIIENKA